MLGTIVNIIAVIIGSSIGLIIKSKLPENINRLVFQAIGLFTVFLGIKMAFKTDNYLVMIFSLVLGSITGELLRIDVYLDKFSNFLKRKTKSGNENFSNGFISSFLLFCMGSMTILGAFEEGINGNSDLLFAKSVLDGFSSIALAATLGIGVIFSVIPLLIYQGGLTLFASGLKDVISDPIINELTAVGGILLVGLGISILKIKNIKVINMIPALIFAVILSYLFIKLDFY